jgi:hypothetical protein
MKISGARSRRRKKALKIRRPRLVVNEFFTTFIVLFKVFAPIVKAVIPDEHAI